MPSELEEEGILKLVFLQEAGTGRKAVVPLVEGVQWDGFLSRVRARLGLPPGHLVQLRDEAANTIDSMDKLLEADESATLQISFAAAAATEMPTSSSAGAAAASRRPVAAAQAAAQTPGGSSASVEECRVEIGTSPGVLGPYSEDGELKYRKRKTTSFRWSKMKILGVALFVSAAVGLVVLHSVASG